MDLTELEHKYQERIHAPTNDPHKFLCHAIMRHDFIDVRNGLENRALDLNKFHECGQTPVMLAVFEGRLDMVSEILKYKPDLTVMDEMGMSVLDMVHLPALVGYAYPKTSYDDKDNIKEAVVAHFNKVAEDALKAEKAKAAELENKNKLRRSSSRRAVMAKRRRP